VQYETFLVSGQEHHMLVAYTADPASVTFARLQELKTIASASTLQPVEDLDHPWLMLDRAGV
jgi:hypothetical protein